MLPCNGWTCGQGSQHASIRPGADQALKDSEDGRWDLERVGWQEARRFTRGQRLADHRMVSARQPLARREGMAWCLYPRSGIGCPGVSVARSPRSTAVPWR